jgi:hypothetical protein
MKEEYRDVSGFEGHYQVSSLGNVFSVKSGKVLSPADNGNGVSASNIGKIKRGEIWT